MPIFEYRCAQCGNTYEVLQLSGEKGKTVCPQCNSESGEKVFSTFAAHVPSSGASSPCEAKGCGMGQGMGGMPPCAGGGCGIG